MAIVYREVYSSNVDRVGHDPDTGELHVFWNDGKHSIYSGVPLHEFDDITHGWSVGKGIHQRIKGNFPHRYG